MATKFDGGKEWQIETMSRGSLSSVPEMSAFISLCTRFILLLSLRTTLNMFGESGSRIHFPTPPS